MLSTQGKQENVYGTLRKKIGWYAWTVLYTEKENEHFLFVSAKLSETEGFLVMRRVHLLIDYVILNESGIVVFRARGIGEGKQSFLFADKSRKSLSLAIENAIQSIEAQTKQEL